VRIGNARAQVNQDAIPMQDAPGFIQGMNHALVLDSSEGAGKDGSVESFAGKGERLCAGSQELNLLWQIFGALVEGDAQVGEIRVHTDHQFGLPGVLKGEIAFAAADVQHALA
jgi:hypothetical protein